MKILKFSTRILIFSSAIAVMLSCGHNDGNSDHIDGFDELRGKCKTYNHILNSDETACVCPEGTHYQLEPVEGRENETPACREILEGSFLYKADVNTCLYDVVIGEVGDWFSEVYDKTGIAEFDFEKQSLYMFVGSGTTGQRQSWNLFGSGSIEIDENQSGMFFHEDGSFSVVYYGFGNLNRNCNDWAEQDPECTLWKVETRGRSNLERTRITLDMTWRNCKNEILDKGSIELWKEW